VRTKLNFKHLKDHEQFFFVTRNEKKKKQTVGRDPGQVSLFHTPPSINEEKQNKIPFQRFNRLSHFVLLFTQ
jgi:hypothetical protein